MINRRKKKVAEDLFEGDYDNRDVLYWNDTDEYFEEYGYKDAYRETSREWDY
jgi:hypothetical protein